MSSSEQGRDLVARRRQAARLHLDQQIAADEIDHVSIDGDLGPVTRFGVPALQGGVQGSFTQRSDPGRARGCHRGISIADGIAPPIDGTGVATYRGEVFLARGAPKLSKPVVFVSDLGLRDEFVGVCHAVIARISPGSTVIDISHGVAPHDVRAGGLILSETLRFAPADAVGLAVIDPGVGSDRLAIAVETESGRQLVGPNNGVLSLAWRADGGARRAVVISSPDVVLEPISSVFHGRDVFAPAAAHLASGTDLSALGPPAQLSELTEVRLAEPEIERGRIAGEVLDIDRFGNVRLNVRPSHLASAALEEASVLHVATVGAEVDAQRIRTYGGVEPGAYGVLVDAWNWMAVIRYEANAAAELGVQSGDVVWLTAG